MFSAIRIAAIAAVSLSAAAHAGPFKADLPDTLAPIGTISVALDEDIVGVENLRASAVRDRLVDPRDAEFLVDDLTDELVSHLTEAGLYTPGVDGGGVLAVTVTKVTPNNPGFTRNGQRQSISASGSVARGGAALKAEFLTADGEAIGSMSYDYFEPFLDQFTPRGAWTTASRTFDRFARRIVEQLEDRVTTG